MEPIASGRLSSLRLRSQRSASSERGVHATLFMLISRRIGWGTGDCTSSLTSQFPGVVWIRALSSFAGTQSFACQQAQMWIGTAGVTGIRDRSGRAESATASRTGSQGLATNGFNDPA